MRHLFVLATFGAMAGLSVGCGDDTTDATGTTGTGATGATGGTSSGGDGGAGATGGVAAGGDGGTGGVGGGTPSLCNPAEIDPFGDFSGPVASDATGNVFAAAYVLADDETIVRAYATTAIAPGQSPTLGTDLIVFTGGAGQLAALSPEGNNAGLVAIAGYVGNPQYQEFIVAAGGLEAEGALVPFLELVDPSLGVTLTGTGDGRIWVGVPGAVDPTFLVVERTPSADCLAPPAYETIATVPAAAEVCVVGAHAAPGLFMTAPTWGRHGGLLTVRPGETDGTITLERWNDPASPTDALNPTATTIDPMIEGSIDEDVFLGYQAIDLVDFDWTLISYTRLDVTGEVLAIAREAVVERFDMYGFYSGATVGGDPYGRLLYSGQSELGETTTGAQALYAADDCALAR